MWAHPFQAMLVTLRSLGTPAAAVALGMADGPSTWMLRLAAALGVPGSAR